MTTLYIVFGGVAAVLFVLLVFMAVLIGSLNDRIGELRDNHNLISDNFRKVMDAVEQLNEAIRHHDGAINNLSKSIDPFSEKTQNLISVFVDLSAEVERLKLHFVEGNDFDTMMTELAAVKAHFGKAEFDGIKTAVGSLQGWSMENQKRIAQCETDIRNVRQWVDAGVDWSNGQT